MYGVDPCASTDATYNSAAPGGTSDSNGSDALVMTSSSNIQIHGGIGFTWEHPAHLYFKRVKSSELLCGDPTYHRELLAQRIGI